MASNLERLQEVCKQVVNEDVTEQTSLRSLNLDSLDMVELIAEIEEEFDVEIDDERAEKFQTIGEILRYLDQNAKT